MSFLAVVPQSQNHHHCVLNNVSWFLARMVPFDWATEINWFNAWELVLRYITVPENYIDKRNISVILQVDSLSKCRNLFFFFLRHINNRVYIFRCFRAPTTNPLRLYSKCYRLARCLNLCIKYATILRGLRSPYAASHTWLIG